MIHRLGSDLETFKTLEFGPGLNILLADKSPGATDRQSRNGAGKTSFIELLHFLFGGDVRRDSIFRTDVLRDRTFDALVDVDASPTVVMRSGRKPGQIVIEGESPDTRGMLPGLACGRFEYPNEEWKQALGAAWFGLRVTSAPFQPSFRSLFSFSARRQQSGGFQNPIQHAAMQQPWDRQTAICYLLGLDWTIPGRFEQLKIREKDAAQLRRSVRSGELGRYFGRVADLRTSLTVSEARAKRLRAQLDDYQVVPQYDNLEREADEITKIVNSVNAENLVDRELIRELRESLDTEDAPDNRDLVKLYAEAGIVLPGLSRRRLEEVERFHRTIIENRRSHLSAEIGSAEKRIEDRGRRRERLDHRRAQIMEALRSGGALEHYTALREELGRIEAESELLKRQLGAAEKLESTKIELNVERAKLVKALRDDIHEREDAVRDAILSFEGLSESLYERAGSLTIDDTPRGPEFAVHIDSERSRGITNMQIFCFDLMLTEICVKRGCSPGFLVHDSHLFDGVDERQVAKALQLGAERAETVGFQYIVTMNSDSVPKEGFESGFNVSDHFLPTKLTDATDDGGLFGFRFN